MTNSFIKSEKGMKLDFQVWMKMDKCVFGLRPWWPVVADRTGEEMVLGSLI
jgi:hypothetical protein